ncbi:glutathione S-transferase C-terminal domain-containing protein [Streptomyces sp. SID3343]|uniref:glutathione S-transferase family protein n=1 Tax=Streptomyces sp. SID3343 TaxID=2690260 RepID=UPI00136EA0A5|nr:glutathione S-transferase C-terminal domain-containing protein [Streptomyces sp. SID3343]MYV97187.1 glutathione S-transferase family protein [Streptomyces sp. SID3343]
MSRSDAQFTAEAGKRGEFVRQANRFTGRPEPEAGRYRLVVSLACPWAHRAVIVRRLLGLEDALGLSIVDPIRDERGWRFTNHPDGRDPVTGLAFLADAYKDSDPNYTGRVTVPAIVDLRSGHVVTNDYPQITLDLSTRWRSLHRAGAPDLYPEHLRDEIDAINADVFRDVNNGVYKCGFATTQEAYEAAFDALFARLDVLEERLRERRYLVGEAVTEADVRLFTTLVRFDAVYHGHFKTNLRKLTEYPVLWAYARDLFQTEGFGDTVDFDHIKRHYYVTHDVINPTGIVPKGPDATRWNTPHGRG